jgi:hypothetical protein
MQHGLWPSVFVAYNIKFITEIGSSVLEIVDLRVPTRYARNIALSSVCSASKIVPLPDAHQLLMLFAVTLTYLMPRTLSIMFYNFFNYINNYYYYYYTHMYEYYPFSLYNGTAFADVHI